MIYIGRILATTVDICFLVYFHLMCSWRIFLDHLANYIGSFLHIFTIEYGKFFYPLLIWFLGAAFNQSARFKILAEEVQYLLFSHQVMLIDKIPAFRLHQSLQLMVLLGFDRLPIGLISSFSPTLLEHVLDLLGRLAADWCFANFNNVSISCPQMFTIPKASIIYSLMKMLVTISCDILLSTGVLRPQEDSCTIIVWVGDFYRPRCQFFWTLLILIDIGRKVLSLGLIFKIFAHFSLTMTNDWSVDRIDLFIFIFNIYDS